MKKHVKALKSKKFIHSNNINKETSLITISKSLTLLSELEFSKDVFKVEFILIKLIIFNLKLIYFNIFIIIFINFNYYTFNIKVIRYINKRIIKSKYIFK